MIQHKDVKVMDDVEEDLRAAVLESIPAELRLRGLPAELLLRALSVPERLQGLSAEEIARNVGPDELARLRSLLERKESNG